MGQPDLFPPASDWKPPKSLPDLSNARAIAVDTETKDTGLARSMGPGWCYPGWGHICGVSIAWGDEFVYLPTRHPQTDCMEEAQVRQFMADLFKRDDAEFFFHNAMYDLGWFGTWGIDPPKRVHDSQAMAVMLDENQFEYNLDAVCARLGVRGKDQQMLKEAAVSLGLDAKKDLWKMPAKYVGPYAEQDAVSTLAVGTLMLETLEREGIREAYELEMDLIPLVLEMRRRGIRIDEEALEVNLTALDERCDEICSEIRDGLTGWSHFDRRHLFKADTLARAFDDMKLPYPVTGKTKKGQFQSDWLENHEHWLPQKVVAARQALNAGEKFLGKYIKNFLCDGRLHSEIHTLRDDTGGTRSYRLAYSNPPLQQMPARVEESARRVRGVFLPEPGQLWGALDYSQQEPRLTVHYAQACKIQGADEAVEYYNTDNNPDYHDMVARLTGLPRKQAKIINLGLAYGMGKAKLAASLGVPMEEAQRILGLYNEEVPFVKLLSEHCQAVANRRGFIKLIDGARCRFDQWEPRWIEWEAKQEAIANGIKMNATTHEEAMERSNDPDHPWYRQRIQRAFTHKSMNRLIQGSAARQTKMAMRECWRQGIVPLIQMHDEMGFSFSDEEEGMVAAGIMEDIMPVAVPMRVDREYGIDWGSATQTWAEAITQLG